MIPLHLTLKNFSSYRSASLDFRGLHTACICGPNGAGKSSLLEAMTWVLWGKSRTHSNDDLIHTGAEFMRVDFEFILNEETYRVIRNHPRGKTSQLDFQIKNKQEFRSLNAKGLKTTQEQIISVLKLDYDTFINSAYLRQGKADEFMSNSPSERKDILVKLLKLDQYERLSDQAKDRSKEYKGQVEQLEIQLRRIHQQIEQKSQLKSEYQSVESQLKTLQQTQKQDQEILQQLQVNEHQRQAWQQQLTWQENQLNQLEQDLRSILQEKSTLNQQIQNLSSLLSQESEIIENYQKFREAQQEDLELSEKFQAYQTATQKKQKLEQQLNQSINELNLQIKSVQTQLENLESHRGELQAILSNETEVQHNLEKLNTARKRRKQLDDLQLQVSPLLQRKYRLESQIERLKSQQMAKLEQLEKTHQQYHLELSQRPQLQQKLRELGQQLHELDKKEVYKDRVYEKGQERKTKMQEIANRQKYLEQQVEELQQKLKLLEVPEATCPLCQQSLDENHRHQIIEKTSQQQQSLNEQIWIIQEENTNCDRELQSLRQEYQTLNEELKVRPDIQQQFNQTEMKLENLTKLHLHSKSIQSEIDEIKTQIELNSYAQEEQQELTRLNEELETLNYDEKTHSLVRAEVDNLRWVETKMAKMEDAKRQRQKIDQEKPKLLEKIEQLHLEIQQLQSQSELGEQIAEIIQLIDTLNYDVNYHQTLSKSVRSQTLWQSRYLELQKTKQDFPQLQERLDKLTESDRLKQQSKVSLQDQIQQIQQQINSLQDNRQEIQTLETKIKQQRQKLDQFITHLGRIEQSLQQIIYFQQESEQYNQQIKDLQKQIQIYQELAQAFGKNGIQTLMIENILPQLEAESNQILARLTDNQLHIRFITQKSSKGRSRKNTKMLDTLDIEIADNQGTRIYETYSGGEAFRINFSIRLAIAKLLAQRMGTALQMLVIDEGSGTQDGEGCERLIAAINGIPSDFACILTITHMPQFKEAFQHRIEVHKTSKGPKLHFSA